MRLQKQTIESDVLNGINGDCFRAVLASLIDVDIEEVPHFYQEVDNGMSDVHEWLNSVERWIDVWLSERGMKRIRIFATGSGSFSEFVSVSKMFSGGMPCIITGAGKSGLSHCVICNEGEMVWDPSKYPNSELMPLDGGGFLIEIIVRPLDSYA